MHMSRNVAREVSPTKFDDYVSTAGIADDAFAETSRLK